jgi:hypothetical protein
MVLLLGMTSAVFASGYKTRSWPKGVEWGVERIAVFVTQGQSSTRGSMQVSQLAAKVSTRRQLS